MRPCASSAETVNTATSSPSALMVARSGVSWICAGSPVVSTLVSAMTLPAASKPFALKVPGAYFTCHVKFGIRLHRSVCRATRRSGTAPPALQLLQGIHADFLAFLARPVPVRQQVQHGVRRPPRLVIVKVVLRKTARVQNAEMRIDARPPIGRRLAAIIKTRPDKAAAKATGGRRSNSTSSRRSCAQPGAVRRRRR